MTVWKFLHGKVKTAGNLFLFRPSHIAYANRTDFRRPLPTGMQRAAEARAGRQKQGKESQNMENGKLWKILLVVLCVLLLGSVGLSTVALIRQEKANAGTAAFIKAQNEANAENAELLRSLREEEGEEAATGEDDVTIGGQFVIRSTLAISDAYRSGDTSKLSDRDKETLDMAKAVLDEAVTDEMSDYEKEEAVYRWLTTRLHSTAGILNVIYTGNTENDNPHDVLKNHDAVCVGYATTFRLLMQMLGIECKVVHSTDLGHSWNMVKLDGEWYHTDCYMDSDNGEYANFNMDDELCASSHNWDRTFFPAATGRKYNYVLNVCEELQNVRDIPLWLVEAMHGKKCVISARFRDGLDEAAQTEAVYLTGRLEEQLSGDKQYVSSRWLLDEKGEYVLAFQIDYYEDQTGETEIDPETAGKLEEILDEALNKYYSDAFSEETGNESETEPELESEIESEIESETESEIESEIESETGIAFESGTGDELLPAPGEPAGRGK